ncbi:hypothetical protein [Bifidobacterium crudilactis]|jgi:hypothetical protein|uniref:hypothetical protein n=1 Tax=Bifidobacterium crudilactis TaxID=327277 RepID=UPI002355C1F2|nr:hypothetical protein [Bifidobacterium crudilactis]MCI1218495.1 hypothetical protein [Bifidobacterium crudilactis]
MIEFPKPQAGRHQWEQPAARADLDLDQPPYLLYRRRHSIRSLQATVDFTELLCQVDQRLDRLLPACWPYHAYLVSVLDALRCDYWSLYGPATDRKGVQHPPSPSERQYRFWQDEDNAIQMMSAYQQSEGDCDHPAGNPARYSAPTLARRHVEAVTGLQATEYYPFAPTDISDDDRIKWAKDTDNINAQIRPASADMTSETGQFTVATQNQTSRSSSMTIFDREETNGDQLQEDASPFI